MKKVLCLIDTLGMGGAERQMIGLSQLLMKRGYQVDLVCYYDHSFYNSLIDNSLCVHILKVGNSSLSKLIAVRKFIIKNNGYNCVIAYKSGPNIIACLLKLLGFKFSLIVSERNTTQTIRIRDRAQFLLYRFADYIVPNSHSQAHFIHKNYPCLSHKTIVITNFTDTNTFVAKKKYINRGDILKVLTTARVAKQKNILRYLDSISILQKRGINNIRFDWYGDVQPGEETYGEEVRNKVRELGLDDMIAFHPSVSTVVDKYQECDIFCLPSNYEGYPNVVCEAMSCGKPILCSRVCDNPYIVREGENALLFDNANVEDMADKIQQLCTKTNEELSQWGARSRKISEELFSMDVFVDKYIDLIER